MLIGIPKEIKNHEYRVGLLPSSVAELTKNGHSVIAETSCGVGSGFADEDYVKAGAKIINLAAEIFAQAEMIVKVKEPLAEERKMLRKDQILFTYLHLAPDREQTDDLIKSGAICIAYETITSRQGGLPLLAPMSEVAGRLSVQAGAHCLEKINKGRGVLLGGVAGTGAAKVVIIGGGIVGINAATIAIGMGAQVFILDNNINALRSIESRYGSSIQTVFSNSSNISRHVRDADLVIGGVLIPGDVAPKLITAEMVRNMKPGSVLVDVAIDQGGCMETSRPTTHSDPTYIVDEVIHYCVTNMPGMVSRTSSMALNNVTLPFTINLANKGYVKALKDDPHFAGGLNIHKGEVTYRAVADAQDIPYRKTSDILSQIT